MESIAASTSAEVLEIFKNNESFQSAKVVGLKEIKARTKYLSEIAEKLVCEAKVICVKEGKMIPAAGSSKEEEKSARIEDEYVKNSDMSDFDSEAEAEVENGDDDEIAAETAEYLDDDQLLVKSVGGGLEGIPK